MKRRLCHEVISNMLNHIPEDKIEFLKALKWNFEDSLYKAPEETLQWQRTMETLMEYIPEPSEDWEWNILSIFTTKDIDTLKKEFAKANN